MSQTQTHSVAEPICKLRLNPKDRVEGFSEGAVEGVDVGPCVGKDRAGHSTSRPVLIHSYSVPHSGRDRAAYDFDFIIVPGKGCPCLVDGPV